MHACKSCVTSKSGSDCCSWKHVKLLSSLFASAHERSQHRVTSLLRSFSHPLIHLSGHQFKNRKSWIIALEMKLVNSSLCLQFHSYTWLIDCDCLAKVLDFPVGIHYTKVTTLLSNRLATVIRRCGKWFMVLRMTTTHIGSSWVTSCWIRITRKTPWSHSQLPVGQQISPCIWANLSMTVINTQECTHG